MNWIKSGWMRLWLKMRIGNGESVNQQIRHMVGSIRSNKRSRNKEKKTLYCNFTE